MFSVALLAGEDPHRLADTLSSLVPAAAEGIIRDVVVASDGNNKALASIADALGCTMVQGDEAQAIAATRGPWVLVITPGVRFSGSWHKDAASFVERHERADAPVIGVFSIASEAPEFTARLRAFWFGNRRRSARIARLGKKENLTQTGRERLLRLSSYLVIG